MNVLEVFFISQGIYIYLSILLRIFGKKEFSQLNVFDFAVFLARFGPFESLPTKIQQFQSITAEFYLLPNTFSSTFHNCFVFPLSQIGEYHCYNLPLVDSNAQFLADEDCAVYPSWSKMFQQNQFLSQT